MRAEDRQLAAMARTQAEWLAQAQTLEKRGDWSGLLRWGQQWSEAEPGNGLAWFALGRAYNALKRYPEAIAAYQRNLLLDPGDVYARNNLGSIYRDNKRYPEAMLIYRETVRLAPEYVPAWYNLGLTFFDQKGLTGVVRALQKLQVSEPELAEAWRKLAIEYSATRDVRVALSAVSLLRTLPAARRERMFEVLLGEG